MTETEIREAIKEAEEMLAIRAAQKAEASQELSRLRGQLLSFTCPYKVGQRVRMRNGKEIALTAMEPSYGESFYLYGRQVLKDGKQLHANTTKIWPHERPAIISESEAV